MKVDKNAQSSISQELPTMIEEETTLDAPSFDPLVSRSLGSSQIGSGIGT